jgi:hypothetical protein
MIEACNKKKSSRIVNESQGGGGLRATDPGACFSIDLQAAKLGRKSDFD